jgi:autotransporter-associated beta strand protein
MRILLQLAIGTVCSVPLLASAGTYTWLGLGASDSWQDSMNWNPSGFPGLSSADVAIFPAAPQSYTPALSSSTTLSEVQFNAAGYTVSLSSIMVLLNGITGTQTGSFAVNASGNLIFGNSASAGTTQITIAPQGRVNFQDSSSAGTATMVVQGTLKFFSASTGNAATANLVGGTLDVSGQSTSLAIGRVFDSSSQPGTIVLGTTSLALGNLNANDTIYGTLSGSGSLTKIGVGNLTLKGNNTYFGTTSVQSGTLRIDGSQAGTFLVNNAAVLTFGNSASAGASSITVAPGASLNFQNASSAGTAAIVVYGSLRFFSTSIANTAMVRLAGGNLDVSGQAAPLSIGSVFDSVAQPGHVSLGATTLSLGNLSTNDTIYGTLSGSGSITKIGIGTLTLSGNNTYIRTTSVQSGSLNIEGSQVGNFNINQNATLGGGGSVGAVNNLGTLRPGGSTSDHLTLASLSCAAGSTVAFSLDTAMYLHFTNALQAAACPVLDISAQTSQSLVSGAKYVVASLDNGSDFSAANVTVHLNQAVTRVHVEANAIVLQVYAADDYVFVDGFDG